MKQLIILFLFHAVSFGQDTLQTKRWSHDVQLKAFSMLFSPGGFEADYQVNYRLSEKVNLGARIGFFYNKRERFRYKMIPIYLCSEFVVGKARRSAICVDLGTSLLLNEDSKRIDNMSNFWVSYSDLYDNTYYRQRIWLITQIAYKFKIYKNLSGFVGFNSYMASATKLNGKTMFFTVGAQLGVSYRF